MAIPVSSSSRVQLLCTGLSASVVGTLDVVLFTRDRRLWRMVLGARRCRRVWTERE